MPVKPNGTAPSRPPAAVCAARGRYGAAEARRAVRGRRHQKRLLEPGIAVAALAGGRGRLVLGGMTAAFPREWSIAPIGYRPLNLDGRPGPFLGRRAAVSCRRSIVASPGRRRPRRTAPAFGPRRRTGRATGLVAAGRRCCAGSATSNRRRRCANSIANFRPGGSCTIEFGSATCRPPWRFRRRRSTHGRAASRA